MGRPFSRSPIPIGKRNLDTVVSRFSGLRPDSPLKVIGAPISFVNSLQHQIEVTMKYINRIVASAALVAVAFSLATFAQIKFLPKTADGNPIARIVLNIESWNG